MIGRGLLVFRGRETSLTIPKSNAGGVKTRRALSQRAGFCWSGRRGVWGWCSG
ncbi:hypothetical protein AXF42_Ash015088 [Apostasia shenzhenica]|uniref:Uncharacterized protein n=1 Tax=Apostasia shenzhenica TaxID=1088818 RepID=A0A2I0B335_9ASPA|nr:hypothetical protein AXF42_Ash015088 [Apostasia shenzhenica]